jgi:hypothetical protein
MAKKIGYTKCEHCGNSEATVKETETGTLSVNCHHCDISSFAKAGTKAARLIRANLVAIEGEDLDAARPPKGAAPKPTPAPAPTPKKPASVFNLGSLGGSK